MKINIHIHRILMRSLMLASLLLPGCWQDNKKEGLFVVNVLDADHFNDCRIKGSINVTLDELDAFTKNLDKEKAEIVFYCSNYMCTASGFAAQKLRDMGFAHVWAYEAGMAEWYQKGLPVEGSCVKTYLQKKIAQSELDQKRDISIISTEELTKKMNI